MVAVWAEGLTKTFQPPLRLDDLVRGRLKPTEASTRALDGVSLSVEKGEIVGVVGPNGAGKTTLLKILSTLVVPDGGRARLAGFPLEDEQGVRRSIGLVTSEARSFYWRLTGRENLRFFASMYGLTGRDLDQRLDRLRELLRLDAFLDRRFDAYSSGMKQRLALARALLHGPEVLLLDEPTRSIDPVESLSLRTLIADLVETEATAVLLVTHDLREVETLCRRVVVLQAGKIAFRGTLTELRKQMGGAERYVLELDGPLDGWEGLEGLKRGHLVAREGATELAVDVAPGASIGVVIAAIHSKGGRVQAVRPDRHDLEQALEGLKAEDRELASDEPLGELELAPPRRVGPVGRFKQWGAFVRRDLRIYLSYRFAFAVGFVGLLFNVAVFFFLSKLIPEGRIAGLDHYGSAGFFPFLLIGIAFRGYLGVALLQFANALRSEQMMGTLEVLLASPLKVSTLLTASAGFPFLSQTLTVAGYLAVGVAMGGLSLTRMNLPVAGIIMIPTIASFAAMGMLSAAFIMTFKRGDPVNFFINAGATLFGGVFFPVEVLPPALQSVSRLLPITYSLEAMRRALLAGTGLGGVGRELVVLCGFAILLLPLGLAVFAAALRKARRDGALGQF